MKGIYLTAEAKQEIEAKISILEKENRILKKSGQNCIRNSVLSKILLLEEILSSATILPVEESWDDFQDISDPLYRQEDYPHGVIIQPKQ